MGNHHENMMTTMDNYHKQPTVEDMIAAVEACHHHLVEESDNNHDHMMTTMGNYHDHMKYQGI